MDMASKIIAQIDVSGLPHPAANGNAISTVLSIVFAVTASIALLMIVIAGFRYIVARGDPNATAQAKNSILYAVIGLLISLAAFSIVTFILQGVGG